MVALLVFPLGRASADQVTVATDNKSAADSAGTFEIGVGVNPDDVFVAQARVANSNLFGSGQRLSLTATVSAIRSSVDLVHEVPDLAAGFDLKTELFVHANTYPGFTRTDAGGGVTLGRQLDRANRVYARYRIADVAMAAGGDHDVARRMVAGGSLGEGVLATLGGGIVHDTLDDAALPRRGNRFELSADRADRRWGSGYDLVQASGSAVYARQLGPLTLRLRGHADYVHTSDPMGVPLAFRLQHDGHAEVRGYGLASGNLVGDNLEASGRAELELPVWSKLGLSVAGWADAGARFNTDAAWGGSAMDSVRRSVGFSLIWRSPIGPLRFDYAIPLDGNDRRGQFLFGFGGAM